MVQRYNVAVSQCTRPGIRVNVVAIARYGAVVLRVTAVGGNVVVTQCYVLSRHRVTVSPCCSVAQVSAATHMSQI